MTPFIKILDKDTGYNTLVNIHKITQIYAESSKISVIDMENDESIHANETIDEVEKTD